MYKRHLIVVILLQIFTISTLQAQTLNKEFPAETLDKRLTKMTQESKINILFDLNVVKGVNIPAYKAKNQTWEQILQSTLSSANFTFKKSGNSYIIVKKGPVKKLQPGSIKGTVTDSQGVPLPGATLQITGVTNLTTISGNDGTYSFSLQSGTYTLEARYISFQTQRITNLVVTENNTTSLNIALKDNSDQSLSEVVVTSTYKKTAASTDGLFRQQQKAAQMSDGISAEQIAKTPDSDVAASLKRITGVTTIADKFVVVRSLGERWNTAVMDGIILPSTDYNNQFSFDIIPTAMVESVVVNKTATPDMNASFAGGYIEVKTKDIPNKDFFSFNWGSSYNSIATFKPFLSRQQGKNDYFGYDDGTRDFPQGLEYSDFNTKNFFEQSKRFTNDNFTTYKTTADPGSGFQLAFGKKIELKNNNKWGFAGAVSSKYEQTILDIDHTARSNWMYNAFRPDDTNPTRFFDYKNRGASYTTSSTVAGMLNFGLQLGTNRFSFRNSYTHTADISLTKITGWNEQGDTASDDSYYYFYTGVLPEGKGLESIALPRTSEYNYPVYQQLLQNKLEGNHKLGNTIDLNWFAARTAVEYDMKDFTSNLKYYAMSGNEMYKYYYVYNSSPPIVRQNIDNDSEDYNFGANIALQLNKEHFKNTIKAGYFGALRENTNQQTAASLKVDENRPNIPASERNRLNIYSFAELLDGTHYEPGQVGWAVTDFYGEKYHGKVSQHAPFLMFDQRINTKWRLVWGTRAEYYKYELLQTQRKDAVEDGFDEKQLDDKLWEFLPSVNFTYSPTTKMNMRLAYSRAVIRPSFQERTAIPFYDPIASANIINAGGVLSTIVNNYDFKWEWFPGLGEILSFGVYHKKFINPIERVGYRAPEGSLELYVANSKQAILTGFEAEIRKSFGFIGQNPFLDKFFVSANFTFNDTKVIGYINRFGKDGQADTSTYKANRPMFGQTPWAYNLGFAYDGERLGLNIVQNAKGDQYITVGYDYQDEEIQRPYSTTDAQLSYRFLKDKNFQVKFNIKNLFNIPIETYNNYLSYKTDNPNWGQEDNTAIRDRYILSPGSSKKYDKDTDELMFRGYRGTTFSLSMNYSF
ncbi:TonB-dependent receptor domain-containing protein [Flavobacterium gyeonganense]|uniref:TonB-dependent receptor domain-containing protein n=1 Tax=Flavobacterium gyeonganense TaxID=1310418 RepID=A0ABV5HEI1_9FLAO|nr:TonB-dependent receptor [Flavobacterium gyeonganense]